MMDFYDELANRGLSGVLCNADYHPPELQGWEKVKSFFLDLLNNHKSVYIEGDYDVDGLMSTLVVKEGLKDLGVEDMYVYNYRKRTHNLDSVAVQQCIQGHYEYFIIVDAGVNDIGLLKSLADSGVKVIVLDHHSTDFSYEDYGEEIAIIDTEIENRFGADLKLSAGALCFVVFDLLYRELGREIPQSFAAYAAASLLADIMDMSNELNRSIYRLGVSQPEDQLPKQLLYFKNQWSKFNARYIEYWFAPRVNACFRAEEFIFLNELFLNDTDAAVKSKCIEMVELTYTKSRDLVHKAADILSAHTIEMDHFVFANLASIDKYVSVVGNKLYNYTGYIANNLGDKTGKTAVVVCSVDNYYKGSLRDQLGRNYLPIFKQLCFSEGHDAAFGMRIPQLDLDSFLLDLRRVDRAYHIEGVANAPIVVEVADGAMPDDGLIRDMARYNEFAGPGIPVALMRKKMIGNVVEKVSAYGYKFQWGDYVIQSNYKVPFGRTVLIKPFFSYQLKMQVQEVR